MKRKQPTHSKDPTCKATSSSTYPHAGDYEGTTVKPKRNYYEVFLNFRGKDTRTGFTDHLYTRLVEAGIHVFRDDNELRVGDEIGLELLQSIAQSKISIPIISENYASSKWCLRELAHMLKCKRSKGQIVLPIFYKVEPSQLRHLAGRFEYAINAHEKNLHKMIVKEWKEALREVGSLKGWESEKIDNGHEAVLVKMVVRRVISELKRSFVPNVPEHLVGIDDPVEQIISWTDAKFNCTRIIGIYGMGGIGKTTLARVLYKRLSSHFEHLSFVANIRETSLCKGIECLQKQLIYDILRSPEDVSNVYEGIDVIKSQFISKKVLILLDDMDDYSHLNALAGDSSWFKAGSIVIITTRNRSILDKVGANYMYQLKELPFDQSIILFSKHAFRKDSPRSDYEAILRDIVSTTGGLPLALEVIGSFLWRKTKEVWKDTLKKLKKVPDTTVQNKLRISYDALDDEDRWIFLDIACFFVGSSKQNPTYMWEACEFFPEKGIEELSLRSLVKVDEDGKLMMHDQLRDLGREIVRLENKKLQKRSRLWICEDAVDVIDSNKGTKKIEALCLHGLGKSYTAEQFKELTNLRFLQVNGANFTGNFQNLLSQLRWLEWQYCPSDFIAANFHPKKLVVLNLSRSMISENWEGWDPLKMATELKVLNLTGCLSLRRTPDLSAFKSLEILTLEDCENLEEIHPSLEDIKTLISLNATRCRRLEELPVGVGRMEKLRELLLDETAIQEIAILRGCLVEPKAPLSQGYSQLVQLLEPTDSFMSVGFKELPESIPSLKELAAPSCSITHVTSSIGHLVSLSFLDLSGCPKLTQLPESIGSLVSLTHLCVFASMIEGLPESIGNLQNLRILDIAGSHVRELPSTIGKLAKLQYLNANFCKKLEKLPSSIGKLVSLNELDLELSSISSLPESISKLSSLQKLHVGHCPKIRELPELPSGVTILGITCESPQLPHLSQLNLLKILGIYHCHWLECLPELPVELSTLWIQDCGKLTTLTLSNLKHLRKLILLDCRELTEVTGLDGLKSLYIEVNECPKLFWL